MNRILIAAATGLIAFGVNSTAAHAEEDGCRANFVAEGNILSGSRFKTFELAADLAPLEVYRRAFVALVQEGFKIELSDKDLGVITAAIPARFGDRNGTINTVVDTFNGSTRITITFSLRAGMIAWDVRASMCDLMRKILVP